jgi:hypothetical protein
MSISDAQECLAKEAESLERAKQMDDEDLKHLHETIAKQWRLLAEEIGTGPLKTRVGDRSAKKTSTSSRVNRKADGGRQSELLVTPRASNAARLRQHANPGHSIPSVAGHSALEPAGRHRKRTRSKATARHPGRREP